MSLFYLTCFGKPLFFRALHDGGVTCLLTADVPEQLIFSARERDLHIFPCSTTPFRFPGPENAN